MTWQQWTTIDKHLCAYFLIFQSLKLSLLALNKVCEPLHIISIQTGSLEITSFCCSKYSEYLHCVKVSNTEFFLVRIFPYSVRIWENTDQKKLYIWTLFTQCWSCLTKERLGRVSWKFGHYLVRVLLKCYQQLLINSTFLLKRENRHSFLKSFWKKTRKILFFRVSLVHKQNFPNTKVIDN